MCISLEINALHDKRFVEYYAVIEMLCSFVIIRKLLYAHTQTTQELPS